MFPTDSSITATDLFSIDNATGKAQLHLHRGQTAAWDSAKRFVIVLAGSQSGKTTFGPWWLWREIQRRGRGDYLAITATFPLLKLKMLPEFVRVFDTTLHLGRWWAADRVFELANPETGRCAERSSDPMWGRVIFGSAKNANSLESATAKAAWLDEAGQHQFRVDAWEAVLRRLSLARGRVLVSTTLYNYGWLYQNLYRPWLEGVRDDVDVIQFKSIENPAFPREEFYRAKRDLPLWKFKMFYEGEFARPAGMVYDSFDETLCVVPPFDVPNNWPMYVGVDFGGAHMAAIFTVEDPETKRLYHVREYLEGGRSIKQHADKFRQYVGNRPALWIGGAKPEEQWRKEFQQQGIPIMPPVIGEVEVGVARVYAEHRNNRIYAFSTLKRYLDEKGSYSYALDESNEPTEEIEDKHFYHLMDAERVLVSSLYALRNRPDPDVMPLLSQANLSRWTQNRFAVSNVNVVSDGVGRWQRGRRW